MFNEINHHIYNNIDILDPSSFGIAKYEMISNDKNRWVFLYTKTEEVIDQLNDSTEYTEFIKNCKKIYILSYFPMEYNLKKHRLKNQEL